MKHRAILLFGAPGTGKGTVGKAVGALPGFYYFGCGDVLRALPLNTPLGMQVQPYLAAGELAPAAVVLDVFREHVRRAAEQGAYGQGVDYLILDGLPRTLEEAEGLADTLEIASIIHLAAADEEELVRRMQRRARLAGRGDDADPGVIRHRLEVYHRQTRPVLDYYNARHSLTPVNALQPPLHVLNQVTDALFPLQRD